MATQNKKRILLVEDDPNFGPMLRDFLKLNNYDVVLATNGIEGLEKFKSGEYDLILLDVMMPYKDGFTLASEIRKYNQDIPIIFITARTMKEDIIKGYQSGADDYITKPFDSEVLLYKIGSLISRGTKVQEKKPEQTTYKIGDFHFDSKLRLLKYKDEEPRKLSPKEAKLLKMLADYKNDLLPREKALTHIWMDDNYFTSRSMDVYIAKLRKYLAKDPKVAIVNIHGEGFRLVDETEE
ncbi:MAG: response regulator transcription factor [Chlorobi bacterium]|nr:response regulator transcription factor [Chlorobiota bacterium]